MKRYLFFCLVFLLVFVFRLTRVGSLNLPAGTRVRVRGQVATEPTIIGNNQLFEIRNVKIKTRRFPECHFGDSLDLTGKVEVRVINRFFKEYWLIYPEIREQKTENGEQEIGDEMGFSTKILRLIYQFRRGIHETYNKNLSEPFASLLAGIVLGIKSQLPRDFFRVLKMTGTLHVVVASGMNLTLFAPKVVNWFSGLFHRFFLILASLLFILIYCAMVGFEPPIVRAAIMVGFSYLAVFLGRRQDGVIALLFSAGWMLIFNPLLLFSLSFQLSFAATGGIVFLTPFFQKKNESFEGLRMREGWRRSIWSLFSEDFGTTLSAQIGVLPLLVANFGEVSVVSLLVNTLVLWTVGYLMALGGILALVGFIFPRLASPVSVFVWPFLFYFVKVVEGFGHLSISGIQVPRISYWLVLIYYLILGWVVWRKWRYQALNPKS